ncbi:hypothetical protein [Natronorubrum sp. DTA7]|uniref:hypothetical protein n=1 Tax=Natronorubrum sp. DTA7 TaxID=3447016 RepID=UPI003F84B9E5
MLAIILGWAVLAYSAYRYRLRSFREKRGVDLERRMTSHRDYEEECAQSGLVTVGRTKPARFLTNRSRRQPRTDGRGFLYVTSTHSYLRSAGNNRYI